VKDAPSVLLWNQQAIWKIPPENPSLEYPDHPKRKGQSRLAGHWLSDGQCQLCKPMLTPSVGIDRTEARLAFNAAGIATSTHLAITYVTSVAQYRRSREPFSLPIA
jgi:hypothetical protein